MLLRLLFVPFLYIRHIWLPVIVVMAILSMVIGNVMALKQTSFKRMMAFSGIGHMGYILIGIIAASYSSTEQTKSIGFNASLYYLLIYFFLNLGIFITAMAVETYGGSDHMKSYNGLIRRNGFMTVLITILLLALIGLPPTTGFLAKFFVFFSITIYYGQAVPWNIILVLFAIITTVIGAYYYMRLAYRMWVLPPEPEMARRFEPGLLMRIAILVPTLLIFLLGFLFVSVPFEYVQNAWFLTQYVEGTSF